MAEQERDYNTLIKYALLKGDISLVQKYQDEPSVSLKLKEMIAWFALPANKTGVIDMINENFRNFSQEEQTLIYSLVKKKLRKEASEMAVYSIVAEGVIYDK